MYNTVTESGKLTYEKNREERNYPIYMALIVQHLTGMSKEYNRRKVFLQLVFLNKMKNE